MPKDYESRGSEIERPGSQIIENTNITSTGNTRPQKSQQFNHVADKNPCDDFLPAKEDCDGSEANESSNNSQQVAIDQNPSQAIEVNDNSIINT